MSLKARVGGLERAAPAGCAGRVWAKRFAPHTPGEADRCPRCGVVGCGVLVIRTGVSDAGDLHRPQPVR